MASLEGHVSLTTALIDQGADVHAVAGDGSTPLFVAAQYGHVGVVKSLVKHGADVDSSLRDGTTPITVASELGHSDFVQVLADHGALPGAPRSQGMVMRRESVKETNLNDAKGVRISPDRKCGGKAVNDNDLALLHGVKVRDEYLSPACCFSGLTSTFLNPLFRSPQNYRPVGLT